MFEPAASPRDTQGLLVVDRVSKEFEVSHRGLARGEKEGVKALDDVSLAATKGETLALVGESGSGKTTLARVIVRLTEADTGHVFFDGEDLLALDRRRLAAARQRIQLVFQDPYSSLNPRRSVESAIAEPARVHGLIPDSSDDREFVHGLLDRVGLPRRLADRLPRELSGGQRQRVAIARALAVSPELLIADEAVSALDVSVQAQILNLFDDLRNDLELTMLFISHQLPVVAHVSDRVVVMYLGRIVEVGAPRDLFAHPAHPYTAGLMEAQPSRSRRGRPAAARTRADIPLEALTSRGCVYRDRCPLATDLCAETRPSLRILSAGHEVACHHPDETEKLRP